MTLLLITVLIALDPFAGVWRLNIAQSNYAPGQCPRSMTIEMTPVGNGVRYHSETDFANGRKLLSTYTAEYGGPEAIVTGTNGLLPPVSLKRTGANTVEAVYTRALQVLASSRRVVSSDGLTMTITTVSKDITGKESINIGVYNKD